jgi:hypothetical protein
LSWLLGHFLKWIEEGCVFVINLLIQSIADAANFVLGLLPDIPAAPTLSGSFVEWMTYGDYWFPVTYLLGLGVTMLALYLAYYVVSIPLRWFKVVRGSE